MIRRIKAVARVGVLGLVSAVQAHRPAGVDLPLHGGRGIEQMSLVPDEIRALARRIGPERARKAMRLRERGIVGTTPELLAYDWLEGRGLSFQFQSHLLGGRRERGGAVVDFLIDGLSAAGWYVWRIQGEYWHQGAEVEAKDDAQLTALRRLRIGGLPVVAVVDLWEDDLYDRYPEVFWQAEIGQGLRN